MINFNARNDYVMRWRSTEGYALPHHVNAFIAPSFFGQAGAVSALPNIEPLSINFSKSLPRPEDMDDYEFDLTCQIFLDDLQKSPLAIDWLQIRTVGQSLNETWKLERKKRLTASSFGRVFHLQDKTLRGGLVKELVHPCPNVGAIDESEAIAAYRCNYAEGMVIPCGLFVHPQFGYLGASPDALVGNDGLLEVKCPRSDRRRYLQYFHGEGGWNRRLNRNSNYFFQIQGQLEVTGRKYCDFVVWTPQRGIEHIERIFRDKRVWDKMFPKLERFYKLSMLPELVDPRIGRGLSIREPDFVLRANGIESGFNILISKS